MNGLLFTWGVLLKAVRLHPLVSTTTVFVGGIAFWGAFNWSLEVTNTESFCISCHAMREYVYREYSTTGHYNNRTGVRASCPDCHVPREWVYKVARKVLATNELFHWMAGSVNSPEEFEAKRPELASRVWASMRATDSRECRNCHGMSFMAPGAQTTNARTMHGLAEKWGKTCIDCHQGVAHTLPKGFDKNVLLDDLHVRMEEDEIECQLCHEDMAGPPPGEGW